MNEIPVIVLSNEKHYWLLPGFLYGMRAHWPREEATIYGYGKPKRGLLPDGTKFVSIDKNNYPAKQWTTGFIKMLRGLSAEYFILMLEDYWLYERVKVGMINMLREYMGDYAEKNKILRIDLTADRAVRKQCRRYENITSLEGHGVCRIIYSPPHTPYQMSYQAAIWNRDLLLEILVPGETAQESEVNGTKRLRKRDDIKVLGTLERPLVYQPVYRAHRDRMQLGKISQGQLKAMTSKGYLKRNG